MEITKIQTWLVRPRWAFIEISTDAGISGWGEPVLEGRAATVCECIHEMEPYLIGADPMKIEDLWTVPMWTRSARTLTNTVPSV